MSQVMLDQGVIEKELGFKIINFHQFKSVFTHKSATHLTKVPSYETLEFMGDAVINFLVARMLIDMFPDADEGFLTRVRTKLVEGKCLARLAQCLGLHRFIVMNDRNMQNGFNTNPRILEDVFEALVGCIYMQNGMMTAKAFLMSVFQQHVDFADMLRDTNYKDGLMRFAQAKAMPLPVYAVQETSNNPKTPLFVVRVTLGTNSFEVTGTGTGTSKRDAEQQAARHALYQLGALTPAGDVCVPPKAMPVVQVV